MIYLDNAATTFPKPECVYERTDYVQRHLAVNVGRGSYAASRNAHEIVEDARGLMATMVNASRSSDVVFTPSATIALNEIIFGLEWDEHKNVYVSPFEHNAVARPLYLICEKVGISIKMLPFESDTYELKYDEMCRMFINDPPDYVFVNHVSNVTGFIAPVDTIAKAAKEFNALIICDASQSLGIIPYDLQQSNIDYLVFAGHKNLYSAFGVGGFINNSKNKLSPCFAGGTGSDSLNTKMTSELPQAFEFASPNIIAIASLNESLKWLDKIGQSTIFDHKKLLINKLIDGLCANPKIVLYLPENRNCHTSVLSINMKQYLSSEVGMILDRDYDIAVRTGYHCAPYIHEMIGTIEYQGTVRISLSYFNTDKDVEDIIQALSEI